MEGEGPLKAYECSITTPLGPLKVVLSEFGLISIDVQKDGDCLEWSDPYQSKGDDRLETIKTFVNDYFYGRDPGTKDIPLDMTGISPFGKRVYIELMKVPYGEVITYGELAERAGSPGGARAVGNAMNSNPYLLIVPCHRVLGSRGRNGYSLGGFGIGLDAKRFLLRSEGHDETEIKGM